MPIDYAKIPSPCFVLDEEKLVQNLELIERVQQEAGVKIILALKGFAMWSAFPLMSHYISSAAASSLNEAKLCLEKIKARAHTYAVAYREKEFDEISTYSNHLTFNSISQFERFEKRMDEGVSCGLRINPEYSDVTTELYNPASPQSRLGVTAGQMPDQLPDRIDGLHFHVLCESDSYALEKVLENVESRFGKYLDQIKWINMGGGHLITSENYDTDHLISLLETFKKKHKVEIILEPGSAFVWHAGDLVSTVLDVVENGGVKTAILDVSFTCHMPDTLEMPYRPEIIRASETMASDGYPFRLGGVSCLAGDFMETYYFEQPLKVGDLVIFKDMMHYTMVKTSMFNGMDLPRIGVWRNGAFELIRKFDYEAYSLRLS